MALSSIHRLAAESLDEEFDALFLALFPETSRVEVGKNSCRPVDRV